MQPRPRVRTGVGRPPPPPPARPIIVAAAPPPFGRPRNQQHGITPAITNNDRFVRPPLDPAGTLCDASDRPLLCCSLSPGGELVVGSADHALYSYHAPTGRPLRRLYGPRHGHIDWWVNIRVIIVLNSIATHTHTHTLTHNHYSTNQGLHTHTHALTQSLLLFNQPNSGSPPSRTSPTAASSPGAGTASSASGPAPPIPPPPSAMVEPPLPQPH